MLLWYVQPGSDSGGSDGSDGSAQQCSAVTAGGAEYHGVCRGPGAAGSAPPCGHAAAVYSPDTDTDTDTNTDTDTDTNTDTALH